MSNAVDPYDPLPRSSSQSLADDVASLRLEHVVSASPPPFALKRHKKPSAASSKEERVEMVSRGELPWTVQRTLGFGAFGAVFDATLKDDERVALKICFTTVKTFGVEREIEILAEIARRRPDATPRAAGELVELRTLYTFAGACALAMRLADTTLSGLAGALRGMSSSARFSEPVALFYAVGILDAVASFHAADFLHGDVKPDNVCLRFGSPSAAAAARSDAPAVSAVVEAGYGVTLIDYSLAVDLRAYADPAQRFRFGAESPGPVDEYCWPPAIKGASWRREVDLYAVGAILYQLLTNKPEPRTGKAFEPRALETRLPRGWHRKLWAETLAPLLNGADVDLVAASRALRDHLEAGVLRGDPAPLVQELERMCRVVDPRKAAASAAAARSPAKRKRTEGDAT